MAGEWWRGEAGDLLKRVFGVVSHERSDECGFADARRSHDRHQKRGRAVGGGVTIGDGRVLLVLRQIRVAARLTRRTTRALETERLFTHKPHQRCRTTRGEGGGERRNTLGFCSFGCGVAPCFLLWARAFFWRAFGPAWLLRCGFEAAGADI